MKFTSLLLYIIILGGRGDLALPKEFLNHGVRSGKIRGLIVVLDWV